MISTGRSSFSIEFVNRIVSTECGMTQRRADRESWPELPYRAWQDTCTTLHLWTQIIGKIRLSLTPWLNHSWHVVLYVTARGLSSASGVALTMSRSCRRNIGWPFDFRVSSEKATSLAVSGVPS
jgi:hypothetical protein